VPAFLERADCLGPYPPTASSSAKPIDPLLPLFFPTHPTRRGQTSPRRTPIPAPMVGNNAIAPPAPLNLGTITGPIRFGHGESGAASQPSAIVEDRFRARLQAGECLLGRPAQAGFVRLREMTAPVKRQQQKYPDVLAWARRQLALSDLLAQPPPADARLRPRPMEQEGSGQLKALTSDATELRALEPRPRRRPDLRPLPPRSKFLSKPLPAAAMAPPVRLSLERGAFVHDGGLFSGLAA